jgi:AcrR family transcriptional regulator
MDQVPSKKRPRTDQRVRRSRERLHRALVELILERGWDRVNVQDVCERAGVGRSTFYVHYGDKEDLLIGGLDDVRDGLRAAWTPGRPLFGFVRGLAEHAGDAREMFRAVIGKKSGLAVQRRFREVVLELVTEDIRAAGVAPRELEVTARYLSGALVELLIWWLDARRTVPIARVDQTFRALSSAVLDPGHSARSVQERERGDGQPPRGSLSRSHANHSAPRSLHVSPRRRV